MVLEFSSGTLGLVFVLHIPILVRSFDEVFLFSVHTDLGLYTFDYTINATKEILVRNSNEKEVFRSAINDEALEIIKTVSREIDQKCPTLSGSEVLTVGPRNHFLSLFEQKPTTDLSSQFNDALDERNSDGLVPMFKMRTPKNQLYQVFATPVSHRRTAMMKVVVRKPDGEELSDIVYKPMDSLDTVYKAVKQLIPHNENVFLVIDNFEPKSASQNRGITDFNKKN